MSSLFVKVCRFERLPHPNADSMFVAVPDGTAWRCCVRHDQFENEELGIYIPVDSLLPEELAAELKLPNITPGEPYRIRTIRLRGQLSQGLLLPNKGRFKEGQDVAAELGIVKYVEPPPVDEDLRNFPSEFIKYTDIENIMNYPTVLRDGEEVVMTEKIHGKTFRAAWINDELWVGSRITAFKPEVNSKWNQVAERYGLRDMLSQFPNMVVYGELFGRGVQSLHYGDEKGIPDLRLFDIYEPDRYLDYDEFLQVSSFLKVPIVPLVYRGVFNEDVLAEHTSGRSLFGDNIREGVVVKPTKERWDFDSGLGRVILKSVSPEFLLKQWD